MMLEIIIDVTKSEPGSKPKNASFDLHLPMAVVMLSSMVFVIKPDPFT